jgi:hypothetical protein
MRGMVKGKGEGKGGSDDLGVAGPGLGVGGPRGYTWPPFTEGHTLSLRHGARSDRFVEPLAQAFLDALLADRPDLAAYPEAVAAWATSEARVERLRVWHGRVGFVDYAEGRVRAAHDTLAFEKQAQHLRERLGLDPRADAELAKTRSEAILTQVDLEGIRQRGREALAKRQALDAAAASQADMDVTDAEVVGDDG